MPVQEFLNSLRIPNEPSWVGLPSCTTAADRRAVSGSSALQNPVQSLQETPGNDLQLVNTAQRKTPETTGVCRTLRRNAVNSNYPART